MSQKIFLLRLELSLQFLLSGPFLTLFLKPGLLSLVRREFSLQFARTFEVRLTELALIAKLFPWLPLREVPLGLVHLTQLVRLAPLVLRSGVDTVLLVFLRPVVLGAECAFARWLRVIVLEVPVLGLGHVSAGVGALELEEPSVVWVVVA